ncbi:MAG: bifunctional nuclease domain-containing protein [Flavobacteriaceae bacterium]
MSLIQLTIKGISYSQTQSGAYALVLSELNGKRTLPIIIGAFEAQAITIALEREIKPPRPLTHDLFKTFSEAFEIRLDKAIIHRLLDGVFYSSLICNSNGEEKTIDARTSDAIALAIRFKAPIYTSEEILEQAGIILQNESISLEDDELEMESVLERELEEDAFDPNGDDTLASLSLQELHDQLNEAIQNEQYELAALLRDEINKR